MMHNLSTALSLLLRSISLLLPVTQMIVAASMPEKRRPLVIRTPEGFSRNVSHFVWFSLKKYDVMERFFCLNPSSTVSNRFTLSRSVTRVAGRPRHSHA